MCRNCGDHVNEPDKPNFADQEYPPSALRHNPLRQSPVVTALLQTPLWLLVWIHWNVHSVRSILSQNVERNKSFNSYLREVN